MLKKPLVFSGLGMAATVALYLGVLTLINYNRPVQAATILNRLTAQVDVLPRIEISMEKVAIEDVTINGRIQAVDKEAIAGDLQITALENGVAEVDLDVSFGLTREDGWILLRKLLVNDEDAAPMLAFLLPAGTETLLTIPHEMVEKLASHIHGDAHAHVEDIPLEALNGMVSALIESHNDVGGTVQRLSDGAVELTVPLSDADSLRSLIVKIAELSPKNDHLDAAHIDELDAEDFKEMTAILGGPLTVVYDPIAEKVRSLALSNVGSAQGRVSIRFLDGPVDAALLDKERVRTPRTRELDLGALMPMLEHLHD